MVVVFEEFDEVGDVCKGAFRADFRDGLLGCGQKNFCKVQSLLNKPAVGRGVKLGPELLLKGGQGAVCLLGELFDRDIGKNIIINRLNKLRPVSICTRYKSVFQAVIITRENYKHKLREFHLLADSMVAEALESKISTHRVEELRKHIGRRYDDKIMMSAMVTLMDAGGRNRVVCRKIYDNLLEKLRG